MQLSPVMGAYEEFSSAARGVLAFLQKRLGLGLWMVTRVEGDDWIVLETAGDTYDVTPGRVLKWSDSFCVHMVEGRGPCVASEAMAVPVYAGTPVAKALKIGSYIGIPLRRTDGTLFGTMCAIDPAAAAGGELERELPLVELLGRLLSSLLEMDVRLAAQRRLAERANAESMRDGLTGLYNRKGWEMLGRAEEARALRHGLSLTVFAVDLDWLKVINDSQGHAAGDLYLQNAARALKATFREEDIVARVGGDEFLVLAVQAAAESEGVLRNRLAAAFAAADVVASIGVSAVNARTTFAAAVSAADSEMYAAKQARHGRTDRETLSCKLV